MKCKLSQIFNLEIEIVGGTFMDKPVKGLINEELAFKPKFYLQKLLKKIMEEKELFQKGQKEMFVKAGAVEKDGQLVLEPSEENAPVIEQLNKEILELLNEDVEFEGIKFIIDDFDFKSESSYPVFMNVTFD
jgi:hypothetical protein